MQLSSAVQISHRQEDGQSKHVAVYNKRFIYRICTLIFVTPVLQSYSCFKITCAQQAIIINSYNNVKMK